MEFFSNRRSVDFSSLFSFSDISEKTQKHLYNVYSLILMCCITCACGMYINSAFIIRGFIMTILTLCLSFYLTYQTLNTNNSDNMRKLYLNSVAFLLGFITGPAMYHIADVDPQIIVQALIYTATAFVSFTLMSLYSKRRSLLFVGGIIACMI